MANPACVQMELASDRSACSSNAAVSAPIAACSSAWRGNPNTEAMSSTVRPRAPADAMANAAATPVGENTVLPPGCARIRSTASANPSIPGTRTAGSAATREPLVLLGPERGEQDDVPDAVRVRQQHDQPVDADAQPARGRQPVLERPQVVLVDGHGLGVAGSPLPGLVLEPAALLVGIDQLGEGVG